jgi:hypothetical protein
MQDHPKGASEGRAMTTWGEDERDQAAVLRWVLDAHPLITYTRRELALELGGGGALGYLGSDAIERALRDLAGTGLLHPLGEDEMVRPTRAAVRYFELSDGAF